MMEEMEFERHWHMVDFELLCSHGCCSMALSQFAYRESITEKTTPLIPRRINGIYYATESDQSLCVCGN